MRDRREEWLNSAGPRRKVVWGGAQIVIGVLLIVLAGGAASLSAAQQPPAGQGGFVRADTLPAQEQLPAAPLVMTAYAIAWVAILLYVWSIWQRLGRVEREIADVTRRVEAGARR